MPQFAKGDRVRVSAVRFDNDTRDRNGLTFSEKWAADGNGEWCYGNVVHVYKVKGRQQQTYKVKYDDGTSMVSAEMHLETVLDHEDSDDALSEENNEMGGSNCEDSDGSTVELERGIPPERSREDDEEDREGNVTSDSEGEMGEDNVNLRQAAEPLDIGDVVEAHGLTWERVE